MATKCKRKCNNQKEKLHLTKSDISIGVLNERIQSEISDTGSTSSAGLQGDHFIITNEKSSKNFHIPNGTTSQATKVEKLEHRVQESARTLGMVPDLIHNTLISAIKCFDADYISICDGNEVNIYDGQTARINISEVAVLNFLRFQVARIWRTPLKSNITTHNTDTLILYILDGQQ